MFGFLWGIISSPIIQKAFKDIAEDPNIVAHVEDRRTGHRYVIIDADLFNEFSERSGAEFLERKM